MHSRLLNGQFGSLHFLGRVSTPCNLAEIKGLVRYGHFGCEKGINCGCLEIVPILVLLVTQTVLKRNTNMAYLTVSYLIGE